MFLCWSERSSVRITCGSPCIHSSQFQESFLYEVVSCLLISCRHPDPGWFPTCPHVLCAISHFGQRDRDGNRSQRRRRPQRNCDLEEQRHWCRPEHNHEQHAWTAHFSPQVTIPVSPTIRPSTRVCIRLSPSLSHSAGSHAWASPGNPSGTATP